MIVLPPVAAAQAGSASGGGLLDTFKNTMAGATGGAGTAASQQAPAPPGGDGSVGLFDGVLKKALLGGAAGAAIGFLPFLPGGPVLGGIVGALGGAAMGVFSNWSRMNAIKRENEAMLAAMGVQADDPQVKQILQSGNVSQLIPLMQQGGVQQGAGVGQAATQAGPAQQAPNIQRMTDPATGQSQVIDLSTGRVIQEGPEPASATQSPVVQTTAVQTAGVQTGELPPVVDPSAAPKQSPVPTQGTVAVGSGAGVAAAINPGGVVSPGVAPASSSGGGTGASEAATGAETLQVDTARLDRSQLAALIRKLQQQVEQLKEFLAEQERSDQLDKAAAR